jgi:hypothetical protein
VLCLYGLWGNRQHNVVLRGIEPNMGAAADERDEEWIMTRSPRRGVAVRASDGWMLASVQLGPAARALADPVQRLAS